MAEPHVLSALKAKRAEIAGLIEHYQQAINQARADLIHIDATLRIFGYADDPGAIPAKHAVTANLFGRGELQRTIFDLLRAAPDGMTCAALSEAIIVRKGWKTGDKVLRVSLSNKVGTVLLKQSRRGNVTAEKPDGRENVWRLSAA